MSRYITLMPLTQALCRNLSSLFVFELNRYTGFPPLGIGEWTLCYPKLPLDFVIPFRDPTDWSFN